MMRAASHPPDNLLSEWARLLFGSLAEAGVRDVVISPGSRSTPFVLAAACCAGLRLHDAIDERAAAFFALGQARCTGRPSLLLCTSGSAAAHYLPAVVEAGASYTPLLILTADRPPELQDCAAPQTIDQLKLYGDHARGFIELGMPDAAPLSLSALRRRAAQAVFLAGHPTPGAVHINARARKPLEPPSEADVARDEAARTLAQRARDIAARPLGRPCAPRRLPRDEDIAAVVRLCAEGEGLGDGLIVCGPAPLSQGGLRREILDLSARTGFALLCEATSQVRLSGPPGIGAAAGASGDDGLRCDAFDALLRSARFRQGLRSQGEPRVVIQIGAPPTSSGWEGFLAETPCCRQVVIAPHGWNDPHSAASLLLFAEVGETLRLLREALPQRGPEPKGRSQQQSLGRRLAAADALAWRLVEQVLAESAELSEAQVVHDTVAGLPVGSLLAVGNSLPIRLLDTYCRGGLADVGVLSQRGANGIDGLISGAAGAASVSGRPVTLLLGDISFLHDLSGLALCRGLAVPLTIVVLQNRGGRIFEQLPIAETAGADALRHFTTPHELSLEHAALLFGHRYVRAGTRDDLRAALAAAHRALGCTIVEALVPPSGALLDQQRLLSLLEDALPALAGDRVEGGR